MSASDREPLSPQQARVYNFMVDYFMQNDQLPSTRAIQVAFRWKSQTAASSITARIRRKGWITRNEADRHKFTRPIARHPV